MAFGLSGSSSKSSQTAKTFVDPNQQPYLDEVRGGASDLYQSGMPQQQLAGLNQNIQTGINNQAALGGQQFGAGQAVMNQGQNLMGGSDAAMGYADNAMGGTAAAGMGTALTGGQLAAGNTANANAAVNMGFNQNNLNNYINNDLLNSQIDAATRDVGRVLNEQTLTGIGSAAAGTGNSGSSRAGMMEGIAIRGAQDRAGDISAGLRGQAYNNALNIESQRAAQNAGFNQQTNLANAGAFNNMYGAGMNMGMNAFTGNQQNQQFGANMAANMGARGVNNISTGGNIAASGFGNQFGAGDYMRGYQQEQFNNQFANEMAPYQGTEFYKNIIGDPTVLSNSTSKSSSKSIGLSFG